MNKEIVIHNHKEILFSIKKVHTAIGNNVGESGGFQTQKGKHFLVRHM
jgi:hypothetical protein